MIRIIAAALLVSAGVPALGAEPPRAVVFPFELIDTSHEGELHGVRADETQRLATITEELRRMMAGSNAFAVIDISGKAQDIARAAPLYKCNGCERDLAKAWGADLAVTGTVQKVSNLILNLNIFIRDARTGALKRAMSVDIRGNTDESWTRGLRWLVRNRLLAEGQ